MESCKFHKLSIGIIIFIFVLTGAPILSAASYDRPPFAYMSTQQKTCKSVSGISPLLTRGKILLFGEMHGTKEIPAFIADVICMAVKKRVPVTLGLEIPSDEQMAIDRFLVSKGGEEAKARLTKGAFWHRKFPDGSSYTDGRTSIAILQLIDQIRSMRASGAKVRIVAYDQESGSVAQKRDWLMAQNLGDAARRESGNLFVVLTGDVHARLMRGTSWNKEFEPMGYLLTKSINSSHIVSFAVSHEGGEAWLCVELPPDMKQTCKSLPLKPKTGVPPAWSVKMTAEPNSAYSGIFGVGRITSSLPVH